MVARTTVERFGFGWFLLAIVAAGITGCTAVDDVPSRPASVAMARNALNAAPQLATFAIEAENSVRIQPGGVVTGGDVGARGTTGPFLSGTVAIDLLAGTKVDVTRSVIADSVRLAAGAVVGAVQTNHFTTGTGASHGVVSPLVSLPPLPAAASVAPGTANLTVANGAIAVASAFNFATVTVGAGATLRLPPGTYQMRDVALSSGARLEAQGPVQLRIANRLAGANGNFVGAQAGVSLTAKDIRIEVSGQDGASGTLGSSPLAAAFASGGSVNALVLVPRGTLLLGTGITAKGAFLARNVDGGGSGTQIVFQDGFANACTASTCDDGNPCTSDTCGANGCVHANLADGSLCNDGDACTTGEACHSGACGGGTVVTCAADGCHVPGVCSHTSGCPAPTARPNGTPCDDGSPCTQGDVCNAGVCTGAPVTCVASDGCHVAGTCDPANGGACSNPPAIDGTACSDGNACTQTDACQGGTCVGHTPVACAPLDACHQAGVCDPHSGACSNPTSPAGTTCAGGNLCDGLGGCVQCLMAATCPGGDSACAARACVGGRCGQTFSAAGAPCGTGLACDGNGACVAVCVPTTCAAQGKTCGSLPDGCGGTLSCGACTAPEVCGVSVPNVCGAPRYCAQVTWTREVGSPTGNDTAYAVAADAAGNIYVAGATQGLDGNPSAGYEDALLIKYDRNGNRLWTRQFGTSGADQLLGVATSATGQVYVTGLTDGTFDGQTLAGIYDMLVAQFDADGNLGWVRQIGTETGEIGYAVATDAVGNVFVGGETSGSLDGNPADQGADLFVIKLDAGGNRLWTRQLGSVDSNPTVIQSATGRGVATDAAGNVFVAGWSTGGIFDGHAGVGQSDAVIAKFDGDGNKLWSRLYGSPDFEYVHGLAADPDGNAYLAGLGYNNLDGPPVSGAGHSLLIKYDGAGNRIWTRQRGANNYTAVYAVTADRLGGVFITGETSSGLDGYPAPTDDWDELFVMKYSTGGDWLWSYERSRPGPDFGLGLASDGQGGVFTAGIEQGNVADNHITYDIVVLRLDQMICAP